MTKIAETEQTAGALRAGMTVYYIHNDEPRWLNLHALLGLRLGQRGGYVVNGTGMDMGFHIVYNLSHTLFGDGYALNHRWL